MPAHIAEATHRYEDWLGQQMPLIPQDLRLKHASMRRDSFSFLRATFYRWSQLWPEVCAEWATAPVVLAVGDGLDADLQLVSDLLVLEAGPDQLKQFLLPRRKRFWPFGPRGWIKVS
jgi:hypothetical protein